MRSLLVILLVLSSTQALASRQLDLKEALAQVESSHPELKLSQFDYEQTLGESKSLRSIFFPVLGVEGGYQKFDSPEEKLSGTYTHVFGEYRFDLGGSQYFKYKAASLASDISKIKYEQSLKMARWTVETKFYRALYLQEALKLYSRSIEQNLNFAGLAKKKLAAGLASEADVIEFDLQESLLKSDLEELKSEYTEALYDLKSALNIEPSVQIELKGSMSHYHINSSLEDLKRKLVQDNYNLRLAQYEEKRAQQIKNSAYGGLLPEVLLKATYGRRGVDEPPAPEQTFFVTARWELFSGFKNVGELQSSSALARKYEYENRLKIQNLPGQLEVEYRRFMTLQNRVDLESQNRERSSSYLKTVMNEYRRGVKNSADLKSASMQILETSMRDLKYRYEAIRQKEVLQKLLGEEIEFEAHHTDHKTKE